MYFEAKQHDLNEDFGNICSMYQAVSMSNASKKGVVEKQMKKLTPKDYLVEEKTESAEDLIKGLEKTEEALRKIK